jgi:hypothetical protein
MKTDMRSPPRWLRGVATTVSLGLGSAASLGCTTGAAPLAAESPRPAPLSVCGRPSCAGERTATTCSSGLWPGGIIRYRWGAGELRWARRAMDDWETLTHGVIHFEQATRDPGPPTYPVLTLHAGGHGNSSSYTGCVTPPYHCEIHLSPSNVYHELGHTVIANGHHFNRYDRRHYLSLHFAPGAPSPCESPSFARCRTPALAEASDTGPFDYRSTMLYTPTHPDMARFDGSPIVPETECGKGSFAVGRAAAGTAAPTCRECRTKQPNGFPTALDASAVIERYLTLGDPGWKKFARTVEEDQGQGATRPFDDSLAPGVAIPADAGPAVEMERDGTVVLYVRGADDHLHSKERRGPEPRWSAWGDLGAPEGAGAISDPAVVSFGAAQTALVVRRGAALHLRVKTGERWGAWASLGAPAGSAASAPTLTSWGGDRLDVLVRGADDLLHRTSCTSGCAGERPVWTTWTTVPGEPFQGRPSAVARRASSTEAVIAVLVRRRDDRLAMVSLRAAQGASTEAMGEWEVLPTRGALAVDPACAECGSPALSARDDGSLEVFVRGGDALLWQTRWSPTAGWAARYTALGGVPSARPGVVARALPGNRQAIALLMAEETTAEHFQYGVWLKEHAP